MSETQFVIVLERALHGPEVVGPFKLENDAQSYAEKHYGGQVTIWRITELKAPQ